MKKYAILKELNDKTLFHANRELQDENGKRLIPTFVSITHKYILLEKTIDKKGKEFYSNAWSANEISYLENRMKNEYKSYFNYPADYYVDFSGKTYTIK